MGSRLPLTGVTVKMSLRHPAGGSEDLSQRGGVNTVGKLRGVCHLLSRWERRFHFDSWATRLALDLAGLEICGRHGRLKFRSP
jgi:hypothetical protein